MKRLVSLLAVAMLTASVVVAQSYDPVARPDAIVTAGNARFTVLTDRLIRMEWSPSGRFEDHATLAIVNRNLPVPEFKVQRRGGELSIRTSALTLSYRQEDGPFSAGNLKVSFRMNGKTVTWHPGMDASGNLMGTARTLDGCSGPDHINYSDPMEQGILSRDGWSIVDESSRHIYVRDDSDWKEWVSVRPETGVQDLYIFAYGHDYKRALADYAKVAGAVPLPPKFVFGYWWSRYWAYTDDEFIGLAKEFRSRNLPIDIMVIDMDWHETWQGAAKRYGRDEFGQGIGWTGYTWNRDLIADPEGMLKEIHSMNLKTALNLHPASGIGVREDVYPVFVADYLSRTNDYDGPEGYVKDNGYHAPVPFRIDQREWADAYFNSVIHPLERQGVDFWWLDWQQWKQSKYVPGLSNTFWLNHTFFNDKVRRNRGVAPEEAERPMIYHRWGGLGSHRYQLGFSGDTFIKWEVLGFLPWFTSTASNVLYGYWGHDLGGHMQREEVPTDPELYTRWLQYGVFSPIFKTHSTSSSILERRFWVFDTHFQYMRDALELRYALSPYIYGMARKAYDTGISICRPLYYEYPEKEEAYTWNQEYFFGDDILAATVCEPVDSTTGLARRDVWLPAGNDWYDMAHHKMLRGGTVQHLTYTIAQNAWFVKAGSIIPMAETGIQDLQHKSNALRLYLAPGKGEGSCIYYEDDETSQAYPTQFANTRITRKGSSSGLTVTIGARQGAYSGMPATRRLTLVLGGLDRNPASVMMDGTVLMSTYNPDAREAVIELPEHPAASPKTVTVRY
ncbi:MAG: DUF5110 domain-containing protein [Bacteroidales bacterium]|nr:DUF5110 domain-containing protein [Bacteroidales bacterium]